MALSEIPTPVRKNKREKATLMGGLGIHNGNLFKRIIKKANYMYFDCELSTVESYV